ncbi:MAG: TolC family protein [Gemmataceae bacterium]|nr:TolC family protein [Gemmataceae bacterium]
MNQTRMGAVVLVVLTCLSGTSGTAAPDDSDPPHAASADLPPPRVVAEMPERGATCPVQDCLPLDVEEVLASVGRHYPLIQAAEQERAIAEGDLLAAEGQFDLNLQAAGRENAGTYPSDRQEVGFQQPTSFMGMSLFGGWRRGYGEFPTYYLDRKTASDGEFRGGVTFPLLRDRSLDRRRASLQTAGLNRQLAEPVILTQRIDIGRGAARSYWTWVAAGRRYQIATAVLRLAQERDAQLAEQIELKRIAPIDREDNRRAIVDRQARQVLAYRVYQQATIALSLYMRDAEGNPVLAEVCRLPGFPPLPPPPSAEQIKSDTNIAWEQRPELRRLALQRERIEVAKRLAQNQRLPGLNLSVTGSSDVGPGKSALSGPNGLDRNVLEAALLFDMPLQRRDARGKEQAAQAQLGQIFAQERMLRDRIGAEMLDAGTALQRAHDLHAQALENIRLTRLLREAEQEKYDLGRSNLLFVTLRELMAAEAEYMEADALLEYFRAVADYLAAQGVDLTAPSRPNSPDAPLPGNSACPGN